MENLSDLGFDCINLGPKVFNREDDYPKYCISVGEAVVRDISMGIDAIGVVVGDLEMESKLLQIRFVV